VTILVNLNSYSITDVGMKRDHNEDFHLLNDEIGFYVVCDGMGGYAAGEVASQLVAKTLNQFFIKNKKFIEKFEQEQNRSNTHNIKTMIRAGVSLAVKNVLAHVEKDPSKKGMGTTMAMTLFIQDHVFIAHIGDSRVYLHRKGEVHQLTEDHSLVNEYVRQGILSREEAQKHPQANVITRAIGPQEVVEPDIVVMEIMKDDSFVICSDGLAGYMQDDELKQTIESNDLKVAPKKLIDLANSKGGKDNITAVLLHVYDKVETEEAIKEESSVDKKVLILKKIPLFKSLTYLQILKTLEIIRVRQCKKGEDIIVENDIGDEMFIILSGEVEVYKDKQIVNILVKGQFFGEMSLIDNARRSATIRANGKCTLMVIKRDALYGLLASDNRISTKLFWAFLQNLNQRLRRVDEDVYGLKVDPAPPLTNLPFLND
jgi:serine/threonine protein phosphatase PrpC